MPNANVIRNIAEAVKNELARLQEHGEAHSEAHVQWLRQLAETIEAAAKDKQCPTP